MATMFQHNNKEESTSKAVGLQVLVYRFGDADNLHTRRQFFGEYSR